MLETARVGRLATVRADGSPHIVPICFAFDEKDTLYTAVDHKPKRSPNLQRLANIAANPRVAVLADHYDDTDWSRLWWVRADGNARVVHTGDPAHAHALDLLRARYPQYHGAALGVAIAIEVTRWTGWSASGL
jgi:PPOX class probable F420-dependent enzyme